MIRTGALLSLTRPVNAVICGFSVMTGGSLGGRPFDRLGELGIRLVTRGFWNLDTWQLRTILAAISATLILAAGNVFNDVRDVVTDRINAPDRALPAGKVSVKAATIFAALLAIGGIALSVPLGWLGFSIALTATVLLVWYDVMLKGIPFAGNVAVALLGGLAFIYGGIAGDGITSSLLPALFAFMFHLGRELIKDAADYEGDRAADISTVATIYSPAIAAASGGIVLVLLAISTFIPVVWGLFGLTYLIIIAVGVLPIIVIAAISAYRYPTADNLHRIAILLKADMPIGIAAVLIGFQQL